MSSVLCRFSLVETTRIGMFAEYTDDSGSKKWKPTEGVRVKLSPVKGDPFGSATPGGNMEMVIANTVSAQVFLDAPIGQEFDVLMTPIHPAG